MKPDEQQPSNFDILDHTFKIIFIQFLSIRIFYPADIDIFYLCTLIFNDQPSLNYTK